MKNKNFEKSGAAGEKKKLPKLIIALYITLALSAVIFAIQVGKISFFNPLNFSGNSIAYLDRDSYKNPMLMRYTIYGEETGLTSNTEANADTEIDSLTEKATEYRDDKTLYTLYAFLFAAELHDSDVYKAEHTDTDFTPCGRLEIISAAKKEAPLVVNTIEWFGYESGYISINALKGFGTENAGEPETVYIEITDEIKELLKIGFDRAISEE